MSTPQHERDGVTLLGATSRQEWIPNETFSSLLFSEQRREQQEKGGVMSEHHRANATTPPVSRADAPLLAADDITRDEALGWHTKPASLVLWPGQAIYLGMGYPTTLHCHYAAQISISLGASLQVRTRAGEPYTEQQSFIVGPKIEHQVEMTGVPSFVLWSEARALVDLARRLSTTSASELPALPQDQLNVLLPVLLASFGQVPDAQAGQALLSHVLTTLIGPTWDEGTGDPRIATARTLVTPQLLAQQ